MNSIEWTSRENLAYPPKPNDDIWFNIKLNEKSLNLLMMTFANSSISQDLHIKDSCIDFKNQIRKQRLTCMHKALTNAPLPISTDKLF